MKRTGAGFGIAMLAYAHVAGTQPAQELPQGFVAISAERVPWQPHPAIRGAEFAILLGRPNEPGPLIVRVKLPPDARVMPHTHPEARTYTVLAGEWKVGFGEKYDAAALLGYAAGSVYRLPPEVAHFQASGPAGAIVQIESVGPTRTDFLDPADDPRRKQAARAAPPGAFTAR